MWGEVGQRRDIVIYRDKLYEADDLWCLGRDIERGPRWWGSRFAKRQEMVHLEGDEG